MMVDVIDDDDFFEEDEPVEDVLAAFDAGVPVEFVPPKPEARNLSSTQGWFRVQGLAMVIAPPVFRPELEPNPALSQT